MKATCSACIRFDPDEYERIRNFAKRMGLPVSGYVRMASCYFYDLMQGPINGTTEMPPLSKRETLQDLFAKKEN